MWITLKVYNCKYGVCHGYTNKIEVLTKQCSIVSVAPKVPKVCPQAQENPDNCYVEVSSIPTWLKIKVKNAKKSVVG